MFSTWRCGCAVSVYRWYSCSTSVVACDWLWCPAPTSVAGLIRAIHRGLCEGSARFVLAMTDERLIDASMLPIRSKKSTRPPRKLSAKSMADEVRISSTGLNDTLTDRLDLDLFPFHPILQLPISLTALITGLSS